VSQSSGQKENTSPLSQKRRTYYLGSIRRNFFRALIIFSFLVPSINGTSKGLRKKATNLEGLLKYAESLMGYPYIYGAPEMYREGQNVFAFDCSGVVQEILKSVGQDPPGDQSSQAYYNHFRGQGRVYYGESAFNAPNNHLKAALAFFGTGHEGIEHVGFITRVGPIRMVEAGGGTSKTKTLEDAIKSNAKVRMRPLSSRRDLVAVIRPHYLMLRN